MYYRNVLATVATGILMAACGGGGGGSAAPKLAEGVYSGTLSGGSYPQFQMLVMDNQEVWAMYGTTTGNVFAVGGFIQGQSASSGGTLSVGNAKDFGYNPVKTSPITGTYTASNAFNATATYTGLGAVSISGAPIVNPLYNYNTAALISDVVGSWNMTDLTGAATTLTIQSNGSFAGSINSGSYSGCQFTGTFTPRLSGKNVMDMTVTFGATLCALPNQTATGIALSYLIGASTRQFIVAGTDAGRTLGTALVGNR